MQTTFKPFSPKQKLALRWWALPQYQDYDAIICDGAVRSGKTVCMSLGFVCWATTCFQGTAFALSGKTITETCALYALSIRLHICSVLKIQSATFISGVTTSTLTYPSFMYIISNS